MVELGSLSLKPSFLISLNKDVCVDTNDSCVLIATVHKSNLAI